MLQNRATATATGLVNVDTISGIADNAVNTSTRGFTITPVGGTISGGNDNYNITYETGTLTINIDVSSGNTAIAANTAKNGISVKWQVKYQAGTKLSLAEMKLLISFDWQLPHLKHCIDHRGKRLQWLLTMQYSRQQSKPELI